MVGPLPDHGLDLPLGGHPLPQGPHIPPGHQGGQVEGPGGEAIGGMDDICSWHELALYTKSITRAKDIRVVSFLRGRVNTAGYIFAEQLR